jgi:hypothetical protein
MPAVLRPQGFGAELFNLIKLSTIQDDKVFAIAAKLEWRLGLTTIF